MTDWKNFHCLGETSVEDFLKHYWQKKPLLIKNAFPDLQSPLSAEELAGLACEDHVNARLVLEKSGDYPWQVEFGPFAESRFSELPESHWSLLVSDVERHFPEIKFLLKPFRFIPDWRVDDLMVSYAPEGGSVGPHTDAYDVFLIQLSGRRLWKIAEVFPQQTLDDTDICVLQGFTAEHEWLLDAGDMMYLPPNVAHHGIAQAHNDEHCMTASVGFRAPSLKTITSDYVNFLNENIHSDERYRDRKPVKPAHHAEIADATIADFINYLKQGLSIEQSQVKRWLGRYCSDNRTFEDIPAEVENINFDELSAIAGKTALLQSPYSNFLFSHTETAALLFVNGNDYEVSKTFAEQICDEEQIDFQQLEKIMTESDRQVVLSLFNSGALVTAESR